MGFLLQGGDEALSDPGESGADIAFRKAKDLGDLRIADLVEMQQQQGSVDGRELADLGVDEGEHLAVAIRLGPGRRLGEQLEPVDMPAIGGDPAFPGEGGVVGPAIDEGRRLARGPAGGRAPAMAGAAFQTASMSSWSRSLRSAPSANAFATRWRMPG
jgi:hypothetical protein